jgi:Domain of unknown function (DUF4351)
VEFGDFGDKGFGGIGVFEDQDELVVDFLERIAAAEQKENLIEHQDLMLRLLSKRMGVAVPIDPTDRIKALSVEQVEALVAWFGEG